MLSRSYLPTYIIIQSVTFMDTRRTTETYITETSLDGARALNVRDKVIEEIAQAQFDDIVDVFLVDFAACTVTDVNQDLANAAFERVLQDPYALPPKMLEWFQRNVTTYDADEAYQEARERLSV
jgi:hypothetical protein